VLARARAGVGMVPRGKYRLDRLAQRRRDGLCLRGDAQRGPGRGEDASSRTLHRCRRRVCLLRKGGAANRVARSGTVRVLDDNVADDGSLFLVMDLLDGATFHVTRGGGGVVGGSARARW
jgi:eukaryotic-like serine/threonine-protein kinase